jgi:hypothetical protein
MHQAILALDLDYREELYDRLNRDGHSMSPEDVAEIVIEILDHCALDRWASRDTILRPAIEVASCVDGFNSMLAWQKYAQGNLAAARYGRPLPVIAESLACPVLGRDLVHTTSANNGISEAAFRGDEHYLTM